MPMMILNVFARDLTIGSRVLDPYNGQGVWRVTAKNKYGGCVMLDHNGNYRLIGAHRAFTLVHRKEEHNTPYLPLRVSDPIFQTGDSE